MRDGKNELVSTALQRQIDTAVVNRFACLVVAPGISGETENHLDMRNVFFQEHATALLETKLPIQSPHIFLRVKPYPMHLVSAAPVDEIPDDRGRHAGSPAFGQDGQPADPGGSCIHGIDKKPGGGNRHPVEDGQEMDGTIVGRVPLVFFRDLLLVDEHPPANFEDGLEIFRGNGFAEIDP